MDRNRSVRKGGSDGKIEHDLFSSGRFRRVFRNNRKKGQPMEGGVEVMMVQFRRSGW